MKMKFSKIGTVLLVLLLTGCSSLPQWRGPQIELVGDEIGKEVVWQEVAPGVAFAQFIRTDPSLVFHVLKVDLDLVDIVLTPSLDSDDYHVAGRRTSSFAQELNLVAAVNGSPYTPYRWFFPGGQNIVGLFIRDGRLISPPHLRYAALLFDTQGRGRILSQKNITETLIENGEEEFVKKYPNGLGGFFLLLNEGVRLDLPSKALQEPVAVTAAGLGPEGRILYVMTVDEGGPDHSVGMKLGEVAIWLRRLGAKSGLLLDSGGSSTMVLRKANGELYMVNTPGFQERIVANHLGIALP